ncbi:hypothetical protein GCM10023096_24330 [Nonomuraea ferruginea]
MLAEAESRFNESNSVVVTHYVIVDMGSSDPRAALEQAIGNLREARWRVETDRAPAWVQMMSHRWKNVLLTVETADSYLAGGSMSKASVWLKLQPDAEDRNTLLVLYLRRMDT